MTREAEQAYVRRWAKAGRALEQIRWRELRALDDDHALRAADYLIEAALLVPLSPARRRSSGLVQQQARFHRRQW